MIPAILTIDCPLLRVLADRLVALITSHISLRVGRPHLTGISALSIRQAQRLDRTFLCLSSNPRAVFIHTLSVHIVFIHQPLRIHSGPISLICDYRLSTMLLDRLWNPTSACFLFPESRESINTRPPQNGSHTHCLLAISPI
jgi:hypothetical protein